MTNKPDKPFGAFIGRFQPFHRGHKNAIDKIFSKGYSPIIVIGSCGSNEATLRNPYTCSDRITMLTNVYPNVEDYSIATISDKPDSDDDWLHELTLALELTGFFTHPDSKLFYHTKEEDRGTFMFDGVLYRRTFWHDCIKHKLPVEPLFDSPKDTLDISATKIREAVTLLKNNLQYDNLSFVLDLELNK